MDITIEEFRHIVSKTAKSPKGHSKIYMPKPSNGGYWWGVAVSGSGMYRGWGECTNDMTWVNKEYGSDPMGIAENAVFNLYRERLSRLDDAKVKEHLASYGIGGASAEEETFVASNYAQGHPSLDDPIDVPSLQEEFDPDPNPPRPLSERLGPDSPSPSTFDKGEPIIAALRLADKTITDIAIIAVRFEKIFGGDKIPHSNLENASHAKSLWRDIKEVIDNYDKTRS